MAIREMQSSIDVLTAARARIKNVFANGVKVYMSFSAGKDSLCMAHITYDLILRGEISAKQLVVAFIDEEALYPSMEQMTLRWYKRFTGVGAEFRWYCLPFKQVTILRHLQNDESWITWEPGKEDVWCRKPPAFAIMQHLLISHPGSMNYQTFCTLAFQDGVQMVGVRASESYHRHKYMARAGMYTGKQVGGSYKVYPIYDWKDDDVWLYIKQHNLDFPEAYMDLYALGLPRPKLRMCNYFGSEAVQGLKNIAESDPVLWQQIERREPNAYLVMLYWDSEMFRRQTRTRTELERDQAPKDYEALVMKMIFEEPEKHFTTHGALTLARDVQRIIVKFHYMMSPVIYKRLYEMMLTGDPKRRTFRSICALMAGNYNESARADASAREGAVQNV